ncbi:phasin [Mesorhizobium sp. J18]|uniref:phasin n=1 Tax=Mesorhizobium sp. J18 TaxID=935263 RepID=UPI0011995095|nr:phasin [Mesorhizobium sp. J18]TWH00614.1 phasin [Mesorhizobium sp. J18]
MTKTATKTAETIEFPAFDASKATDQFRAFAEKGVEQSKQAYDRIKSSAEETQKALEASFESAKAVGSEFSQASIAALRTNAEAGFTHLEALIAAKSLSELIELQSAFVSKSFESSLEQVKALQAISTKAATEVSQPIKDVFEKSLKELKVA